MVNGVLLSGSGTSSYEQLSSQQSYTQQYLRTSTVIL
ncbi:uncharacterized protein METZ01_LOCUS326533 [marine metagenome]|uniref:Uncharacterized protein n=1 Tax=marine metagenome TaxID=408172 RepID=A0A382PJV7_9ZZZZ